ncbi:GntR family transcriptional regulator [Bosea sp. NBC_00550]|uniref:GntR family transcriptional regulator n=1 Tax=Bosea sp. NBC_00550 TaxID=2969621 RepID=UPI00222ED09A|nr:GntR family transcriptional regulator [Bosea sp. NBC_00550]UZF90673.1 GntR family transcriptional regulator [Bosea sp. NBC_00550]
MIVKPVLARVALVDQVTAVLMERILDRAYAPGEKLNIDALTREFEVSSSPIREALTRLSALGLVASASFTGFSVAPEPPREWFEQLRDFRILNEGWAARQLARSRDPHAIARMRASIASMERDPPRGQAWDYVGASRADEIFHEAILEGAGNEILAQAVRGLHPHLHHARLFSRIPHDIAPMLDEHRAILGAVLRGDEDGAQAAVESHLKTSWHRYNGWHADRPEKR